MQMANIEMNGIKGQKIWYLNEMAHIMFQMIATQIRTVTWTWQVPIL